MANIPISSFTAAANTTGIGMSGFSLTGSNAQSIIDLAGTWNTSGTPTGIKLNVLDTASNAASLLMDLQVGGVSKISVGKDGQIDIKKFGGSLDPSIVAYNSGGVKSGFYFPNSGSDVAWTRANSAQWGIGFGRCSVSSGVRFSWSASGDPLGTEDLILARDAANTLAQRNGVNAQTSRIYNTYTDASNYERGFTRWNTNVLEIGSEAAGTGTGRAMSLISGTASINLEGASGLGADVVIRSGNGGTANNNATLSIRANSSLHMYFGRISSQNGIFNSSAAMILGFSTASMVHFFGTTSSFPSLKRSTTSLQARLADDTAFTNIQGKLTTDTAYTAGTVVATGYLTLYDSTGTAYRVPCVV